LLKSFKMAILASNLAGIWRMSVYPGKRRLAKTIVLRPMSVRALPDSRFSWMVPASAFVLRLLAIRRKVAFVAVLFLLLLCSMPPDGLLTDNEENYFQLAERFVTDTAALPDSAIFDSAPHRALDEVLLGGLVVAIAMSPRRSLLGSC
jgi:hypothetical protein